MNPRNLEEYVAKCVIVDLRARDKQVEELKLELQEFRALISYTSRGLDIFDETCNICGKTAHYAVLLVCQICNADFCIKCGSAIGMKCNECKTKVLT